MYEPMECVMSDHDSTDGRDRFDDALIPVVLNELTPFLGRALDPDRRDEILQEVAYRLVRKRPSLPLPELVKYAARIAQNLIRDGHRRQKRAPMVRLSVDVPARAAD